MARSSLFSAGGKLYTE